MTDDVDHKGGGRVLDSIDRNSEVLLGLFMVMPGVVIALGG